MVQICFMNTGETRENEIRFPKIFFRQNLRQELVFIGDFGDDHQDEQSFAPLHLKKLATS